MSAIEERYRQLHPKSALLYQEALSCFPSGVTHDTRYLRPYPFYVTHAQGSRKWDVDGNEYICYHQGHGALLLGHCHPEVVRAGKEQFDKAMLPSACHEVEVRWARLVQKLVPSAEKLRFHSSGTEATQMALRLARGFTGKGKILKFRDHFHGWNDYMVKGGIGNTTGIPSATLETVVLLPPNDISLLERTLQQDGDIAAVIMEPTGGYLGLYPMTPDFVRQIREVTRRYGVLLIFDEVVTGFRVSPGGAQEFLGVIPDLTLLGKILTGGLPGGAVAGRADILDLTAFGDDADWYANRRISHQGTYNGNPMAAATGIACLNLIATQPINARADAAAQAIRDGLNDLLHRMEIPGCVHGIASHVHIKIGRPCDCDRGFCTMSHEDIKATRRPAFVMKLKCALSNAGVDTAFGTNLFVSSAHSDGDVQATIGAYEQALTALREEQLL